MDSYSGVVLLGLDDGLNMAWDDVFVGAHDPVIGQPNAFLRRPMRPLFIAMLGIVASLTVLMTVLTVLTSFG